MNSFTIISEMNSQIKAKFNAPHLKQTDEVVEANQKHEPYTQSV